MVHPLWFDACRLASRRDVLLSQRALFEPFEHSGQAWRVGPLFPFGLPWPGGMTEQCNRHRRIGGQCVSAASLPTAGVGEPRRAPGGSCHGQHGFGSFCRNKRTSSYGGETPESIFFTPHSYSPSFFLEVPKLFVS